METLLIVLCVMVILLATVMFSPVVIAVDSRDGLVSIRWLLALEFRIPLPGAAGQKCFTLFHRQVPILGREPAEKATGEKKEKPAKTPRLRRRRQAMGRFLVRCLGDSGIRRAMARQLSLLLRRIFHSTNLTRAGGDISMPDPALNGMLAGALAACNRESRRGIWVNFAGENSLFLELHLYPHRVLKAFLFFLPGLPYRAVFRQWRAFAAARPH